MVNPNAKNALEIANDLDSSHQMAAIRNGAETARFMEELVEEAQARRLAAQSFAALAQVEM